MKTTVFAHVLNITITKQLVAYSPYSAKREYFLHLQVLHYLVTPKGIISAYPTPGNT